MCAAAVVVGLASPTHNPILDSFHTPIKPAWKFADKGTAVAFALQEVGRNMSKLCREIAMDKQDMHGQGLPIEICLVFRDNKHVYVWHIPQ